MKKYAYAFFLKNCLSRISHIPLFFILILTIAIVSGCAGLSNTSVLSGSSNSNGFPTASIQEPEETEPEINESGDSSLSPQVTTEGQDNIDERYSRLKEHTLSHETADGYNLNATLMIGNWIKASDEQAMMAGWTSIGGTGMPPSINVLGEDYRENESVVAFGSLALQNDTPGWDITSENSLGTTLNFTMKNQDGFYTNSSQRLLIDFSNGIKQGQVIEKLVLINANMTANKWGPVRFMFVLPNIFTPKTPNGNDVPDREVVFTWATYVGGIGDYINFQIDKSWELP